MLHGDDPESRAAYRALLSVEREIQRAVRDMATATGVHLEVLCDRLKSLEEAAVMLTDRMSHSSTI